MAEQLQAESKKHRNPRREMNNIPKELLDAAKSLRNINDITIRKADKSSMYVILKKEDYISKINNILSDTSKFKQINKDPTKGLKQKANNIISTLNATKDSIKLDKIIGKTTPGYIYGTIKTHKPNNPIRPIISQIPTPLYNTAKQLNVILTPYMPNTYLLKSTNDFVDLIHTTSNNGIIASLDVESLFTNVPINETIDIILQYVYNHSSIPPPKVSKPILKELLELCTKESPFYSPDRHMFIQQMILQWDRPSGLCSLIFTWVTWKQFI